MLYRIQPWSLMGRGVFHRWALPAGGTNFIEEGPVGRSGPIWPLMAILRAADCKILEKLLMAGAEA